MLSLQIDEKIVSGKKWLEGKWNMEGILVIFNLHFDVVIPDIFLFA